MITKDIKYYAKNRESFSKKELLEYLLSKNKDLSKGTVNSLLFNLVEQKQLCRIERGKYAYVPTEKNEFIPHITTKIKAIDNMLKDKFPFVQYCIWSGTDIAQFMHHVPNLPYIYIDIESVATESVFNLLSAEMKERIFLKPTSEIVERYMVGNESIIIRPLISEAPLQMTNNCRTPTMEKILVDVIGNVEFDFMAGNELYHFYQNVFDHIEINTKKLLRYANRRGRKEKIEEILQTINH